MVLINLVFKPQTTEYTFKYTKILYKSISNKNNALSIKSESGLRTIRTSRDVNRRLFLYLKSSACKAFPRIFSQCMST